MESYEKLGVFYLGRIVKPDENNTTDELLLYDSKDLTTHAMCVGMTGSGKTGLGISLIEEAAIDNLPVIVVDPKGDMTNLLLTFPDLLPDSFLPWINPQDAQTKGIDLAQYAAAQAETWKNGLLKWGQTGDRIKHLKESAEFCIYTPGSTSGLPISILKSFNAPPEALTKDSDAYHERIATSVTSLLGLLKIDADPLKSREYILISNILDHFWAKGKDLDLSNLIHAIQAPPLARIGVFDLDSFYPAKERFELAISLNNLLASPSFKSWLEGAPLDIGQLIYTETGKPRVPIFYIAHLSDTERMFFVSLLLNQVLGWMRTQAGSTSLRAILYIDELFGYMPPISNPPSKKPLLTLLKQARAFGLGVILATQNPVDLDYKGLANTGTWFIGRLQTERDRMRVLDGLTSAAESSKSAFDHQKLEKIVSGLGKRKFLMYNVHEDRPEVFETRWVMSYLAGPLTRTQIEQLTTLQKEKEPIRPVTSETKDLATAPSQQQPALAADIPQLFVPSRRSQPETARLHYCPYLWASAQIHFVDSRMAITLQKSIKLITPITDEIIPVDWEKAVAIDLAESELLKSPEATPTFDDVPAVANQSKNYKNWHQQFEEYLYRTQKLVLFKSPVLKQVSEPLENERDFRIRLQQIARERRDDWLKELREKYAGKIDTLETKIRRAEERLAKERDDVRQQQLQSAISIGTTLFGAILNRRTSRSMISRTGRAVKSSMKEKSDVELAEENLYELQQQIKVLDQQFQQEVDAYTLNYNKLTEELVTISINLSKNNIFVKLVSFVWLPFWRVEGKPLERAG